MERLDRLFDTYAKRCAWLLLGLSVFLLAGICRDYFLGARIAGLEDVPDLYSLLDTNELYDSLAGQIVLYSLEYKRLDPGAFVRLLGYKRILCVSLHLLLLVPGQKKEQKLLPVFSSVSILSFLTVYVLSFLFLYQAVGAMSVAEGMGALKRLAFVLQYGSLMRIVLIMGGLFWILRLFLFTDAKEA